MYAYFPQCKLRLAETALTAVLGEVAVERFAGVLELLFSVLDVAGATAPLGCFVSERNFFHFFQAEQVFIQMQIALEK
jgi:hypothetical protein